MSQDRVSLLLSLHLNCVFLLTSPHTNLEPVEKEKKRKLTNNCLDLGLQEINVTIIHFFYF